MDKYRQIPEGLYQRLLEYLQLHAVTHGWSEELLKEFKEDAEVTSLFFHTRYWLQVFKKDKFA